VRNGSPGESKQTVEQNAEYLLLASRSGGVGVVVQIIFSGVLPQDGTQHVPFVWQSLD
jgi:hypothetical protein